jgi:hypothetical protein
MSTTIHIAHGLVCVAALSCFGCSEAVPPAAEGAFTLVFQSVGTGGESCNIGPHNAQLGYTDSTKNSELKKDTIAGAQIFCRVMDSGGEFEAQGYMELGATHLNYTVSNLSGANTASSPALGHVSYRSVDTVRLYTSPGDAKCEFFFDNDQEVAAGRVWMQFSCPQIANAASNSSCAISLGTIAMQNCDQET